MVRLLPPYTWAVRVRLLVRVALQPAPEAATPTELAPAAAREPAAVREEMLPLAVVLRDRDAALTLAPFTTLATVLLKLTEEMAAPMATVAETDPEPATARL
jgi:hypothetical protein